MSRRVLIVDDDLGILETIQGMLELEGYEVDLARDGVEALQQVARKVPELIILDIMMPRMDGYTMASELQRQGLRGSIPLIVLTADGRAAEKAARIGANGYLEKPFVLDKFIGEVARVLGQ